MLFQNSENGSRLLVLSTVPHYVIGSDGSQCGGIDSSVRWDGGQFGSEICPETETAETASCRGLGQVQKSPGSVQPSTELT